jgi:uncharacterized protein (TIGR00251 family)
MTGFPFRQTKRGLFVFIRLTPSASANRIEGVAERGDGEARLKARVTAKPDKGAANKSLLKLLAKSWHVPPSSLEIAAGHTARNKTVLVQRDIPTVKHNIIDMMEQT